MMNFAHSRNKLGQRQELHEHLLAVARRAQTFAEAFGAGSLAFAAGALHDIGKFDPAFQQYLADAEAQPHTKHRGPDHKGAGAVYAAEHGMDMLAFLIQGHHGGLPDRAQLKEWLRERGANPAVRAAIRSASVAAQQTPFPLPDVGSLSAPRTITTPWETEFFLRLLFSALVDADFLDTEEHFQAGQRIERGSSPTLAMLWNQFEINQTQLSGRKTDDLNRLRHEAYCEALSAAGHQPGFFRLTAPTGIGKTRISLGFALHHAMIHGLDRIIYAIPYTSITEQTADEFRRIFAEPGSKVEFEDDTEEIAAAPAQDELDEESGESATRSGEVWARAVLEHHSAIIVCDNATGPTPDEQWSRLAAENWDAPLVVTTTVQLFESLMNNGTSACRKLHNIARSMIILDEAQMLPPHLLETTLDALRQLVTHYGASVMLCTATQPALDARLGFPGLTGIVDVLADPQRLFAALQRVEYHLPAADERWSWQRVADEMRGAPQSLAVVNTRADAVALLQALDDPAALHLSTWMCGAHRRAVLRETKRRLLADEPCYLVATQVIEAGVDIDFPLVLRALGPLDRIVQAAGRCNREGKLDGLGQVIVFDPEEGRLPPGSYRTATDISRNLLAEPTSDLHDPTLYHRYFEQFYRAVDLDTPQVQAARKRLDFPEVAALFRMIEDDTTPVIVRYPAGNPMIDTLLNRLRTQVGNARQVLRRLQSSIVGLRPRELMEAQKRGLVSEVIPGLWEWQGRYEARGIVLEGGYDPGDLMR